MKLFVTLSLLAILHVHVISAQDLRTKLETVYTSFCEAVKNKDATGLKNAMSSYSYLTAKNELLSAQLKFPDAFFSSAPRLMYDLSKHTFIKAMENGPTANGVYLGKDAFGSESLIIIKFLKESNNWKFYTTQIKISDDLTKKLKAGDSTFLKGKDFYPDGVMPVTPAEIIPGEYKALMDVMGNGYKVNIKVNGIAQAEIEGRNSDVLIIGGLHKGVNKIEINATSIPGKTAQRLTVNVATVIEAQEFEVFALDEATPVSSIVKEFTVK